MKPVLRPPEKKGIFSLIAFSARLEFRGFVLIILTLVLSGVLEGFGILTLFPVLQMVVDPQNSNSSLQGSNAWIITGLQSLGVPVRLEYLVAVMCLGIFGKALFLFLGMRMVTSSVSDLMAKLRTGLARASLQAKWNYFQSKPSGSLVNRLTNETYKAGSVYYYACQICANAIQVCVYAILSLLLSWKLTIVAGFGALLVMLVLHRFVRIVREAGRTQVEVLASISARFTDYLQGIKPLKAMGLENRLE
ncbi:MAG TPA: ABC transporter transmembrane domain-containing protein, partial [Bdellovibrionota bacterium]